MDKTLHKLYYSVDSPACYGGKKVLYNEAKKLFPKIKWKDIETFLAKQDTYTLHKPIQHVFPRNKIVTAGLDVDWQADLADLRNLKVYNSGYTYILVVVDVLSRYLWAVPLKRKTPKDVAKAFANILHSSGRMPWRLCTDKGTEFKGEFAQFLKQKDIEHFHATSPDVKAAIAERFIRTLKGRLWKYFTQAHTFRYVDVLPQLVNAINHSVHRITGMRPADVNQANAESLWQKLYGDVTGTNKFRFNVGDHVRITREKNKLAKGYMPTFTKEVFVVKERLANRTPATYRLKAKDNEDIEGIFYEAELVRVLPWKST